MTGQFDSGKPHQQGPKPGAEPRGIANKGALRSVRSRLLKWLLGALFALTAVTAIVFVIETHRLPPHVPKSIPKPVVIQIVPNASKP